MTYRSSRFQAILIAITALCLSYALANQPTKDTLPKASPIPSDTPAINLDSITTKPSIPEESTINTPALQPLDGLWDFLPLEVGLDQVNSKALNDQWGVAPVPGYWAEAKLPSTSTTKNWAKQTEFIGNPMTWNRPYTLKWGWYRYNFKPNASLKAFDSRLVFNRVAWNCDVWLNGKYIGGHKGGYAPFDFDLKDTLKAGENNELLVMVWGWPSIPRTKDSRAAQMIGNPKTLPLRGGGIPGPVSVRYFKRLSLKSLYCEPNFDDKSVKVQITLRDSSKVKPEDKVDIYLSGPESRIPLSQYSVPVSIDSTTGLAGAEMTVSIPEAKPWWPWRPYLYTISAVVVDEKGVPLDLEDSSFGLKKFVIKDGHFLLNNEPIYLRGLTMGEEGEFVLGNATTLTPKFAYKFLSTVPKATHANTLRFAYGPPTPEWLDLCDMSGTMAIVGLPIVPGSNSWQDTTFGVSALKESQDLVTSLVNHPSIIMWSLSEEGWDATQRAVELQYLMPAIQHLDPTRPIIRAGDLTDSVASLHYNDGMTEGSMDTFQQKTEQAVKSRNKRVLMNTKYVENSHNPDTGWTDLRALKLNYGTAPGTLEDQSYLHAEIAATQTEILRMNKFDGIFPAWYGDIININGWLKNMEDDKYPLPKPTQGAIKNAFAPVAPLIDLHQKTFTIGQTVNVPIKVANDTPAAVPVKLEVMLLKQNPWFGTVAASKNIKSAVYYSSSSTTVTGNTVIPGQLPVSLKGKKVVPGTYYLVVLLTNTQSGDKVLSQRRITLTK